MIIKKVLISIVIITLLLAYQDIMAVAAAKKHAHILVPSSAVKSTPTTEKSVTATKSKPVSNHDEQNNTPAEIAIHPNPDPDGYSVSVSSVPVK